MKLIANIVELIKLLDMKVVKNIWVRGHAVIEGNEKVDV